MAAALEVLVELAPRAVDRAARPEHPRAETAREQLELPLGLGVEADPAEAGVGDGHEQPPDRRVEQVVRDVEQALGGRCVAEATVQVGRDAHSGIPFRRSRRTPEEAAWRAASALEPSAAPISS